MLKQYDVILARAVATGTAGTAGAVPVFSSRAGRGKEAGQVMGVFLIY